ncbi:GvpL/GvpF family gas vesicle protein [Zooshikella sp. RANM57]|uniref:GvpL/GvpF family gas vesicle protein n=1 Tax=Zooshikella sp. RANM57 TaxID=3425863 RepID=UPI003D6E316C
MSTQSSNKNKFIYALVDSTDLSIFNVRGVNKSTVYSLACNDIAAIVSDLDKSRVRPDRRNIMAHREVLEQLMRQCNGVLPMRFGIVAQNSMAVKALMSANIMLIKEQMQRVWGQVEMGLRVTWDVDNIYEYFVATHPLLREARDSIMVGGREASRAEKIELGRIFDQLLMEERKQYTDTVVDVLQDYCTEISVGTPKVNNEVMNISCLVKKDEQDDFEKGIFEASKLFNNDYLFNYTGPWAPHSFVDLELQTPQKQTVL